MDLRIFNSFKLTSKENTALHKRLYSCIASKICSGDLAEGDKLPPILKLAEELSIGGKTVQKVYEDLKRDGLVVAVRGNGSFVAPDKQKENNVLTVENFSVFGVHQNKLREEFKTRAPGWDIADSQFGGNVVQVNSSNILNICDELEDITDLVKSEFSDLKDPCIKSLEVNGRHYFMPTLISTQALYFRPGLIEEANLPDPRNGWDMYTLLTSAQKLADDKLCGFAFSVTGEEFLPFLWQAGLSFPCEDSPEVFLSPTAIHAAEFVRKLAITCRADCAENDRETPWQKLCAGKAAFYIGQTTGLKYFQENNIPESDWGVAPLPVGVKPAGLLVFYGHGIVNHTETDEAKIFLSVLGRLEHFIKDVNKEKGSLALHSDLRASRKYSNVFMDNINKSFTIADFFQSPYWKNHIPSSLSFLQIAFRRLVYTSEPVVEIMEKLVESLAALNSGNSFHEQFYFTQDDRKCTG